MEQFLIVDGYNIIGAWPELTKLKKLNLEEARDRLIDILSDYQGFAGVKVYLVFDAHQIPGLGGKYEQCKVNIYYTKEKETADELIERLVTRVAGRRRQVYVATSDLVEQHVTFGSGALRMSARELLDKVKLSKKEIRNQIKDSPSVRHTVENRLEEDVVKEMERMRRRKSF